MKYNYWFPFFMLLCFFQQSVSAQTCYLTEKITTRSGNSDTIYYVYDDETHLLTENRYKAFDNYYKETYRYYERTLSSVFDGMFTHSYFTDKKGRIEGVIDFDDLGVSNFYQTFTYDNKDRLVKHTSFETPFMEDTLVSSYNAFYYDGDKMVKMEEFTNYPDKDAVPNSTTLYEYITLKNAEYNPIYFPLNTTNAVVSKLTYKDSEGVNFDEYCYTRQCTSNKEGYPVKCTVTYFDGTVDEEVYIYRCK